jgi:hypothetical protein
MGMALMALAALMMAGVLAGTTQVLALEVGELQAVPSSSPPYIFRLPINTPPQGPSAIAAVTVRQPPDALSFVKQHVLELRLRALTDVELEVSQGGQTLNRLLLKSELQAARTRLEAAPTSHSPQPIRAKGRDQALAEAKPLASASEGPPDRTLLEREIDEIRQEVQNLVGRVTPWQGLSLPAGPMGERSASVVVTLMLGGLFSAGITSLVIGYLMQCHAVAWTRQRRRVLAMSMRRRRDRLAAGVPILPAVQPAPLSRAPHAALAPVTVMGGVRLAQKTQQRFRLVARTSQRVPSTPADLVEALAQLRRELMRLQKRPPTSTIPKNPEVRPGHASRSPC